MNRRILVIDDNAEIHSDFQKILGGAAGDATLDADAALILGTGTDAVASAPSYELAFAGQGQEGLRKLCEALDTQRPFALAFVDMRMPPGWDGLETIKRLWERDDEIQVVICTAYSDHSWSDLQRELGTTDRLLILKKPFDVVEVSQLAKALTEKWTLGRLAKAKTEELETMVQKRTADLHSALEELRRTNERLHEMYQVENERNHLRDSVRAMEQVLGIIGHELRTPLAGLRCSTEFLMNDQRFQDDQPWVLIRGIHQSAVQMAHTLEHLLEAARLNSGTASWNWGTVSLEKTCDEALDAVRPMMDNAKVRLELRVEPRELAINGDADAIRRLVQNLISNSRKHTTEGRISVDVTAEAQWVRLRVQDSGCGIPPQILSMLGVPFALSQGAVGERCIEGSGLGLSICHSIAAAHGGQMQIDTEPGKGTVVTVRLRADLPEPVQQRSQQSLQAA